MPKKGVTHELIGEDWAQFIDANFPVVRGHHPPSEAMNRVGHNWKNERFDQLVDSIRHASSPDFTDAIFLLFDIAGETADNLIKVIETSTERCRRDGRDHDFSMVLEDRNGGISYLCVPDASSDLPMKLTALGTATKYKSRADEWLELGAVANSPRIVDVVGYSRFPWVEDPELEELTASLLTRGTAVSPDGRKLGRNERCWCDSGKKFKRCHGA